MIGSPKFSWKEEGDSRNIYVFDKGYIIFIIAVPFVWYKVWYLIGNHLVSLSGPFLEQIWVNLWLVLSEKNRICVWEKKQGWNQENQKLRGRRCGRVFNYSNNGCLWSRNIPNLALCPCLTCIGRDSCTIRALYGYTCCIWIWRPATVSVKHYVHLAINMKFVKRQSIYFILLYNLYLFIWNLFSIIYFNWY